MDLWDRFWRAAAPWLEDEEDPLHQSLLLDPSSLSRHIPEFISRKLLGFFYQDGGHRLGFTPMLDLPDNTHVARFAMPNNIVDRFSRTLFFFIGCCHGVALLLDSSRQEAILWDPITGDQRRVAFPRKFGIGYQRQSAAVLCSTGDDHHRQLHGNGGLSAFKLVMVWHDTTRNNNETKTYACLYESLSDAWGDIISTTTTYVIANLARPSVMVGNALYWLLSRANILELDTEKQTLVVIEKPSEYAHITGDQVSTLFQILRREDNSLGLAVLSSQRPVMDLWARESSSNGVISWALQETIQLDECIPWLPWEGKMVLVTGYDEDANVIFLSTFSRDFMLHLESMQLSYIGRREFMTPKTYYPYTNFYTTETPHEDEEGLGSSKHKLSLRSKSRSIS